jgi:PAS domain S-box-containing protein
MDTDDILMHMRSGLITLDPGGRIIYFNDAAGELLGVNSNDVKGKFLKEAMPATAKQFCEKLSELLEMGGSSVRAGEYIYKEADGETKTMHITCSFLTGPDSNLRGIITLFEDITERKRREEYLKEVEKMAAIGELSASLAHEIRNPLAAIRASVETLSDNATLSDDSDQRLMRLIIKETDRLTHVLDEFLIFARIKELPVDHIIFNKFDISRLISEVVDLLALHPVFSKQIDVKNHVKSELWVLGREEQLKDVFYNLFINAMEALGEKGGTILIEKVKERSGFSGDKRLVGVSITDNGPGIPPEIAGDIFRPFFSTKPRGTGLGLAIAQGIVNRHGGIIEAENVPSGGAKFTVFLLKAPDTTRELF